MGLMHVLLSCGASLGREKVCIYGPGHMTKMAAIDMW